MDKRKATIKDMSRVCRTNFCSGCPLGEMMHEHDATCLELIMDHPGKVSDIILKWIDEHPVKTYKRDFLEKFPNAALDEDEVLPICVYRLYGGEYCCSSDSDCKDCWNEEMPDEK